MKDFLIRAYSLKDFNTDDGIDFLLVLFFGVNLFFLSILLGITFVTFEASAEGYRAIFIFSLASLTPVIKTYFALNKKDK